MYYIKTFALMAVNTQITIISNDTIMLNNLFYDLLDNQFVINAEPHNYKEIESCLSSLSWHGRKNPIVVGKPIICRQLITECESRTFGDSEQKMIFLARRYSPHNFGHLMCETAIPIEHLFNTLNIEKKSERIIIFDDSSWDGFNNTFANSIYWFEGDDFNRRQCCDMFSNNLFKPIADTVIFDFKDHIHKNAHNARYFKITNPVLFGIGNISPWSREWKDIYKISDAVDTLRQKIYDAHSISKCQSKNTLTFIVKIGRRQVLNFEQVGAFLKVYAIKHNLNYKQINLEEISFEQQINILSRTHILVTNGGSSAFCSLLMTKIRHVVYFPILNNDFESNLFKQIDGFHLVLYEQYDTEWKKNITRDDGSFTVDLCKLDIIMHDIELIL